MNIRDRVVELRRVKASDLQPNPANWRTHPKKQANALKGLLAEIGYANALLARETPDGLQLIDGHLRAETTPDTVVPVLVLDVNEAEAKKLLLSLDPLAAMAEADSEALSKLLAEVDTENEAVQAMFDGLAREYDAEAENLSVDDPGARLDAAEELQKQWGVERGQLWLMGEHRLLCGDATNPDDVKRLLGDERPVLMATDPPYGVSYDADWRLPYSSGEVATGTITNDDRSDWSEVWALWDVPVLYVWHGGLHAHDFAQGLIDKGYDLRAQIIWNKPIAVFGRGAYHWKHEPCWFAVKKGANANWHGGRDQNTVWDCGNNSGGSRTGDAADDFHANHISQKPVELFRLSIRNHTAKGDLIAEPFAGSGSQFIAAEQLHRRCYGMEIEPKFVAVTLERWQKATGRIPELSA